GGTPHPFSEGFKLQSQADGDGRMDVRLFDLYTDNASRQGAGCDVRITASGAGSYSYWLESTTAPPAKSPEDFSGTNTTVNVDVNMNQEGDIVFIDEATNHRFLYAGTGGANFGTCHFNPDPPQGDQFAVVYSSAPGPGWGCCTFPFH